jgi:hypothetical protein
MCCVCAYSPPKNAHTVLNNMKFVTFSGNSDLAYSFHSPADTATDAKITQSSYFVPLSINKTHAQGENQINYTSKKQLTPTQYLQFDLCFKVEVPLLCEFNEHGLKASNKQPAELKVPCSFHSTQPSTYLHTHDVGRSRKTEWSKLLPLPSEYFPI